MCVAGIAPILAIAQAAVGFASASQQASEQNAAYDANRKAAIAAANDRYAADNYKVLQEREKTSQELFQKQTEALKARSTAAVSAGEAGVNGLSVDALETDFLAQQGRQAQALQTNFDNQKFDIEVDMENTYHNTVSRINSVRRAAKPSPLPFLLQAVGGIAKGA